MSLMDELEFIAKCDSVALERNENITRKVSSNFIALRRGDQQIFKI